jgi:O-6-methylguanine DNA methyltransferase
VVTYGQIAEHLGNRNLSRAVGNILHQNPDPDNIPCHRVLNRNGRVSDAYAFGGPDAQRARLEGEGITFQLDGTVDLRKYGFFDRGDEGAAM